MPKVSEKQHQLKEKLHEIIFEADTPAGKAFDVALLVLIALSVLVVILESVDSVGGKYAQLFVVIEWSLTIIFTIEYILRLYCVGRPIKYAMSFFGIIDLMAILPSYMSLLLSGSTAKYLMVVRALRLLRIFRILKLAHFVREGYSLTSALKASRRKILVFLFFVVLVNIIMGALIYLVESKAGSGFDNIPISIYWSIVTMTTVGYGDIHPVTPLEQFLAACLMILGYAVLAVPTGIVTSEITRAQVGQKANTITCRSCASENHDNDAKFCKYCGDPL
jgi:voltage-gated potassium channel